MEVNDRGHDHRFGTGAHPEPPHPEPVGLESLADDPAHHAASEAHGLIENLGTNLSHLATNLEHLPAAEHDGLAHGLEHGLAHDPDHDFGTHHDGADGLQGLHDTIHHESAHLGFGGEEHHGLAGLVDDTHHDDPADHHHHPDAFGLGH